MQKRLKLSLFSFALMSIVLGSAFAVNSIIESWKIKNTAISVTGRLAVYNLDGSEALSHDWGEFRISEVSNWTVIVQNIGGDRLNVGWWVNNGLGLSEGWSIKAYWSYNASAITNVYPSAQSNTPGSGSPDSCFVVWVDPGQQFYAEFILQKTGAGSNIDFTLELMSVTY
jgi:hypothetical protein